MIAGLILAAGAGMRFGPAPKLLADSAVDPGSSTRFSRRAVSPRSTESSSGSGPHAEEVLARVDFGEAEPVVCEDWRDGLAASLRRGVTALNGARKVLVTPQVIARFIDERPGRARPTRDVPATRSCSAQG